MLFERKHNEAMAKDAMFTDTDVIRFKKVQDRRRDIYTVLTGPPLVAVRSPCLPL